MIIAKLTMDSFGYKLLFLLHLLFVIVGFGSSFVWPTLAARARKLSPAESYAINSAGLEAGKFLTTYSILAAGFFGVALVGFGSGWEFSQTWISISFVLFLIALVVSFALHTPNLREINKLQETLVSGGGTPSQGGGPPAEVVELQARGKRAGIYGGILHLLFLLLMIDMIWKPGFP